MTRLKLRTLKRHQKKAPQRIEVPFLFPEYQLLPVRHGGIQSVSDDAP